MTTSSRKLDHIRICLEKPVEAKSRPFDDLVLIHKALPEIDEADIDTSLQIPGKKVDSAPHHQRHDRRPSRSQGDQCSPGRGGIRSWE